MDTVPPPAAPKDFLSILDLGHTDLARLIALAADLKVDRQRRRPAASAFELAGIHVALLFEKPSLRTRCTFEVAVRELGGHTLTLPATFADGTREPIQDVARN